MDNLWYEVGGVGDRNILRGLDRWFECVVIPEMGQIAGVRWASQRGLRGVKFNAEEFLYFGVFPGRQAKAESFP